MRPSKIFCALTVLAILAACSGCGGKEEPLVIPPDQGPKGAKVGNLPTASPSGGGGATAAPDQAKPETSKPTSE